MANFYYEYKQPIVLNGIDDAIVSYPNSVEVIVSAEFFRSMRARRCCKRIDF